MSSTRFPIISVRLDSDQEIGVFKLNGDEDLKKFFADVREQHQRSVAQSQRFHAAKRPEQYALYQNGRNMSFLVVNYPVIETCDVELGRTSPMAIRDAKTAIRGKLHDVGFAQQMSGQSVSFHANQDAIPVGNPNDVEVQKAKIAYGYREIYHYRATVSEEKWNEYEQMQIRAQQPEPAEDVVLNRSLPR